MQSTQIRLGVWHVQRVSTAMTMSAKIIHTAKPVTTLMLTIRARNVQKVHFLLQMDKSGAVVVNAKPVTLSIPNKRPVKHALMGSSKTKSDKAHANPTVSLETTS